MVITASAVQLLCKGQVGYLSNPNPNYCKKKLAVYDAILGHLPTRRSKTANIANYFAAHCQNVSVLRKTFKSQGVSCMRYFSWISGS